MSNQSLQGLEKYINTWVFNAFSALHKFLTPMNEISKMITLPEDGDIKKADILYQLS